MSPGGIPLLPFASISRRDFMRLSAGAATAAGLFLPGSRPVVAQVLTSFERELLLLAIEAATSAGADYADGRVIRTRFESIGTREQTITQVQNSESFGINIRALKGGSWGFSATQNFNRDAVVAMAREAVAIAAANNEVAPSQSVLAPVDVYTDVDWVTPHSIDPFTVSLDDKAAMLLRINEEAMRVNSIRFASSSILSIREDRLIATTEGSLINQTFFRISPDINITAISADGRDFQTRSAVVEPAGRGYEYIMGLELAGNARRWAEEAAMKLEAT
ncbi:MAG: DNA gyrase modulator, partial [Pseudohongiellaceae bacterium]